MVGVVARGGGAQGARGGGRFKYLICSEVVVVVVG